MREGRNVSGKTSICRLFSHLVQSTMSGVKDHFYLHLCFFTSELTYQNLCNQLLSELNLRMLDAGETVLSGLQRISKTAALIGFSQLLNTYRLLDKACSIFQILNFVIITSNYVKYPIFQVLKILVLLNTIHRIFHNQHCVLRLCTVEFLSQQWCYTILIGSVQHKI